MEIGNKGFVYVMVNPSLEGMVKIGMTKNSPEERAAELSSATGIPTPFMVVYYAEFEDAVFAEKYIHEKLEGQGSRVNANREFFKVSPKRAVDVIIKAVGDLAGKTSALPSTNMTKPSTGNILAEQVFSEAENYKYGKNGEFQDYKMALKLYRKAAKLNYAKAYYRIAEMAWRGEGCKYNLDVAKSNYVLAGKSGYWVSYIKLFELYYCQRWGIISTEESDEFMHNAWIKFLDGCKTDDSELDSWDIVYGFLVIFLFDFCQTYTIADGSEWTIRHGSAYIEISELRRIKMLHMRVNTRYLTYYDFEKEDKELLLVLKKKWLLDNGSYAGVVTRLKRIINDSNYDDFLEVCSMEELGEMKWRDDDFYNACKKLYGQFVKFVKSL